MCPVRVKFTWNRMKAIFSRDNSFAIFHDHCVQKVDMANHLTPEIIDEGRTLIRQSNKKITANELAETLRVKHFVATHLIKTTPLLEFHALPDQMSTADMMSNLSNMGPQ